MTLGWPVTGLGLYTLWICMAVYLISNITVPFETSHVLFFFTLYTNADYGLRLGLIPILQFWVVVLTHDTSPQCVGPTPWS